MVDGCRKVVIPPQEVLEIQYEHSSHAIVGEPLAELIDDDEEDAQGVAKAVRH